MRPITAKVWLRPALVPSLVGGAVESISSQYRRSFSIITINITLLSSSLVLPSQPKHVRAVEVTQSSLRLSWTPGFGGDYPVVHCSVQVRNDCVCRTNAAIVGLKMDNAVIDKASPLKSLTLNSIELGFPRPFPALFV